MQLRNIPELRESFTSRLAEVIKYYKTFLTFFKPYMKKKIGFNTPVLRLKSEQFPNNKNSSCLKQVHSFVQSRANYTKAFLQFLFGGKHQKTIAHFKLPVREKAVSTNPFAPEPPKTARADPRSFYRL